MGSALVLSAKREYFREPFGFFPFRPQGSINSSCLSSDKAMFLIHVTAQFSASLIEMEPLTIPSTSSPGSYNLDPLSSATWLVDWCSLDQCFLKVSRRYPLQGQPSYEQPIQKGRCDCRCRFLSCGRRNGLRQRGQSQVRTGGLGGCSFSGTSEILSWRSAGMVCDDWTWPSGLTLDTETGWITRMSRPAQRECKISCT